MAASIPGQAAGFLSSRMQRWFAHAEGEPAFTELLYVHGHTFVDIAGELVDQDDSDLNDDAVISIAGNAAVLSDEVFNRDKPFLSVLVPPDWRCSFWRPPVVERPEMTLRKLRRLSIPLERYVSDGVMTWEQKVELEALVAERKNVVISGEVGSGKTTLLRSLLGLVPEPERICTIEDPRELILTGPDSSTRRKYWSAYEVVHGVSSMADLLRSALRARPDRIIVGEVRGPEALELVRSLNTGWAGSLFTLHSNRGAEVRDRLHTLVVEAQPSYRFENVERAIDAAVHISGRGRARRIDTIWRPER